MGEGGHVTTEAEMGVMHPQATDDHGSRDRGLGQTLPQPPEGASPAHTLTWAFPKGERICGRGCDLPS